VHAFEPVPHVFESLVNNTRLLKNVRAYPFALSDSCGTATMFVSDGRSNASSSLLPPKDHLADHPDVFFPGVVTVPTTTLDNWAVVNDISHVDFLWLDMQGFELAAMMAAPHILRTVTVFYTEVSLTETYAGVALYPEVRNWLEGQGFRVVREELPWADAGNVLFVRPNGDDIVYA